MRYTGRAVLDKMDEKFVDKSDVLVKGQVRATDGEDAVLALYVTLAQEKTSGRSTVPKTT